MSAPNHIPENANAYVSLLLVRISHVRLVGSLVMSGEGLVPRSCGRVESPCSLLHLFSPGLLPPDCPEGLFHVVFRPQSQGAHLPLTRHIPLSALSIPLCHFTTGPLAVSNKQTNQPGKIECLLKSQYFRNYSRNFLNLMEVEVLLACAQIFELHFEANNVF
jgi:hypothetical protein